MLVERDLQAVNAVRLFGMLTPDVVVPMSGRIAAGLAPAITTLLQAELDRLRSTAAAIERQEREMMAACKALGAAVDRLEQAMHTREEIPARRALIVAAKKVRTAMRRRDRHDAHR